MPPALTTMNSVNSLQKQLGAATGLVQMHMSHEVGGGELTHAPEAAAGAVLPAPGLGRAAGFVEEPDRALCGVNPGATIHTAPSVASSGSMRLTGRLQAPQPHQAAGLTQQGNLAGAALQPESGGVQPRVIHRSASLGRLPSISGMLHHYHSNSLLEQRQLPPNPLHSMRYLPSCCPRVVIMLMRRAALRYTPPNLLKQQIALIGRLAR